MTPERWQAIDKLYHAALELSGDERAALLSQADSEVRSAVEAMLAQNSRSTAILDRAAWESANPSAEVPPSDVAPALTPGVRLGPYLIESAIGAGGMGQVYRAIDTRLNRHVAIKTSTDRFSDRFAREARTIAALSHPNICQIYDVGPNYIVMELVDGEPLPKGPLPADTAVRLAIQIASALEAAHAKGIIHRDLKPANILVAGSVAKLLDFGLAKQNQPGDASERTQTMTLTQAGVIMGTPAYMSPEQAEGKEVDARSDIFSFGDVLYEMLAGKQAFSGGSAAAVIGAILHREPEPLDSAPALAAIVRKCLAKSPDARFQSATELRQALEGASLSKRRPVAAIATVVAAVVIASLSMFLYSRGDLSRGWISRGPTHIDSIAVLPLDIKSADPDAEYISDGITETLNNSLARLPGLRVVPHSIALRYKGKSEDLQKVGAALGVEAVLIGRVTERGDEVTVAVELDDVGKGKQLWGDRYQRRVSDLLYIQGDIVRQVSQRLRSGLSPSDEQQLARGSTENPEAYQLYLKGKYHTSKFTKDDFRKGLDYFQQALAKDPNYGLAYSGSAYYYILQDDWYLPPDESAKKAKAAAMKAVEIDDGNAEAHLALALEMQWYERNWVSSEREFQRAITLSPKFPEAASLYSWLLAPLGRRDEALRVAGEAQRMDPLSQIGNFAPGSVSVFTGQWDRAIQQLRAAIDLDATYWLDYIFLGRAYEQKSDFQRATEAFEQALKLDQDHAEIRSALGHVYGISGNTAEARKVLTKLQTAGSFSYVAPYNVAIVYAGLGDTAQTFAWLERAFEQRSYYLATYFPTDERLNHLHTDPRFIELKRRLGLP
jgi:serine/threonine protein kinase/tetratricopeptide (TPR) repeat protein